MLESQRLGLYGPGGMLLHAEVAGQAGKGRESTGARDSIQGAGASLATVDGLIGKLDTLNKASDSQIT